ncbi:MAG TPA: cyclase family protein [Ktedonobacteraceae bacterium]|jgi:arylformamidase|nr:cyclase family protein [Ktedonobacteraceae bacterium]
MTEALTPQEGSEWIDISVPIFSGMAHWPDNPEIEVEFVSTIANGDPCNVSSIAFGAHTGTHMDAPLHFIDGGKTIDQMPLDATIGKARVIAIHDPESIKVAELEQHAIQPGERILFKTRNSPQAWQTNTFVKDFVFIEPEAAQYLAEHQVQTVGVDYLSVGSFFRDGAATHRALLGGGIWVIEGLNLGQVEPGDYELICLPLRLQGTEGGPARAIVRALKTTA